MRAQRIAYDCVVSVGQRLYPGITELEAARMLADELRAMGSERFLHRPFAWFGEHSRFDGYQGYGDYHPGHRRLRPGEVAILDVSPVVDGYTADVAYTMCLEANPQLVEAQAYLLRLREALPQMFASAMTPKEIWMEVDRRITEAGYDDIHARYPFCVLGHRVFRVRRSTGRAWRLGFGAMGWFSMQANRELLGLGPSGLLSPENVGPKLGLWAIEPHIGWPSGGAKFEEILVVDHDGARWLDDDVPHVRAAKPGSDPGPEQERR